MNDQLKPEISSSYEAGLDMKFLNNRLGFDFTYYYSRIEEPDHESARRCSPGVEVNGSMPV